MSVFGRLFGKEGSVGREPSDTRSQIPHVESIIKPRIADFQARTNVHYILIFPVMHKVAVRLMVEDFGVDVALRQYEDLVASITSDGIVRESQYKNFGWPEVPRHEVAHVQELDAMLWRLTRDLIGQGFLKEAIAQALLSIAMTASAKMDALLGTGFLISILKELRAGIYTPAPEVPLEPPAGAHETAKFLFIQVRDLAYKFKDRTGLEWQHLLPGMQRMCAVSCIRYRGREGALALFRDQVAKLSPILDQNPRNPPQKLPLTPLHVTNMATFNNVLRQFADSVDSADVHPVYLSHALAMLVIELTSRHYDMIFLSSILACCCDDIERGQYDFVTKTH